MKLFLNKFTCFFLCFMMILTSFVAPSAALQRDNAFLYNSGDGLLTLPEEQPLNDEKGASAKSIGLYEDYALGVGEKGFEELIAMNVDVSSIPECVPVDNALSRGHVNRLYKQESRPDVIIYQNIDGTKTTYIFSSPVKYIASDGSQKDKSSRVSQIDDEIYRYAVLENNVQTYFSSQGRDGISVRFSDYIISMSPSVLFSGSNSLATLCDNQVSYSNVFGKNTSVTYTPKLSGCQMDIVLHEKPSLCEYNFNLTSTGLIPSEENGRWCFKSREGEIVAFLGEFIIEDSNGKYASLTVNISPSKSRDSYNVVINIPGQFINDSTLQYPLQISSNVNIDAEYETALFNNSANMIGADSIIDVALFRTAAGVNDMILDYDRHLVGKNSSDQRRVIYKFYDFYSPNGMFSSYSADQLVGVYFHFNLINSANTTLSVNPMKATWDDEADGTNPWYLVGVTLSNQYSTVNGVSISLSSLIEGFMTVDVTDIAVGWAKYNCGESFNNYENPANGMVLSSSSSQFIKVSSCESQTVDNPVFLEVHANPIGGNYYIYNEASGGFLSFVDNSNEICTKVFTEQIREWYFQYVGNDEFCISTLNGSYALCCDINDKLKIDIMPSNLIDRYKWRISSSDDGEKYAFTNVQNDLTIVLDLADIWSGKEYVSADLDLLTDNLHNGLSNFRIIRKSEYIAMQSFSVTYPDWIDVGDSVTISVDPTNDGATWTSSEFFTTIVEDDDIVRASNGLTLTGLSNGISLIEVVHEPTQTRACFMISVGQIIDSGAYRIQNRKSNEFLFIEPAVNNVCYVNTTKYGETLLDEFYISYDGDGRYTISPVYLDYCTIGLEVYSPGGSVMLNYSELVDRWSIFPTLWGGYKIVPEFGESDGFCMSTFTTDGRIRVYQYSNDFEYSDEWSFVPTSNMFSDDTGITVGDEYYIMNAISGLYMSVVDSNTIIPDVRTESRSGDMIKKWKFVDVEGKTMTYNIISCDGVEDMALDVTGTNVDVYHNYNYSDQQFKLQRVEFAPYQGCYIITRDYQYVYVDETGDVRVTSDFSEAVVWSISRVDKGNVYRFDFDITSNIDTTGGCENLESALLNSDYSLHHYSNSDAVFAISCMVDDCSIFIFNGHGENACIAFYDEDGNGNGCIYADHSMCSNVNYDACIGEFSNNELAGLQFAMYLGCQTGRLEGDHSLLESTYKKGCHLSIGTIDTIYTDDSFDFEELLWDYAFDPDYGYSVGEAIELAVLYLMEVIEYPTFGVTWYFPVICVGDLHQHMW